LDRSFEISTAEPKWEFPEMENPQLLDQNAWFIMEKSENPIKMDDEQGYLHFRKPPNLRLEFPAARKSAWVMKPFLQVPPSCI
jgi:hypothetical protein